MPAVEDVSGLPMLFLFFVQEVHEFITKCFKELGSYDDWVDFYLYLVVRMIRGGVTKLGNDELTVESLKGIIIPKPCDIVGVCRLFFQSLVTAKVCIADGQHRMMAVISALTGHVVKDSSKLSPPVYFDRPQQGPLFTVDNELYPAFDDYFNDVVSKLCRKNTTYVCFLKYNEEIGETFDATRFQNVCKRLSEVRETSARNKEKYNEVDV